MSGIYYKFERITAAVTDQMLHFVPAVHQMIYVSTNPLSFQSFRPASDAELFMSRTRIYSTISRAIFTQIKTEVN